MPLTRKTGGASKEPVKTCVLFRVDISLNVLRSVVKRNSWGELLNKRRIYAVGDIHGRLDLLLKLQQQIIVDSVDCATDVTKTIVYLGDYIDRGYESKGVVENLVESPLEGFEHVFLVGNHDEALLSFLEGAESSEAWLNYGGAETIYSYGVRTLKNVRGGEKRELIRESLTKLIPERHLLFFKKLEHFRRFDNYFFVHAGVDPDNPLTKQNPKDLVWIREKFLNSEAEFGAVIVHGHTISEQPVVMKNRIGVDTGAYVSNKLTAVVLEGDRYRFLTT